MAVVLRGSFDRKYVLLKFFAVDEDEFVVLEDDLPALVTQKLALDLDSHLLLLALNVRADLLLLERMKWVYEVNVAIAFAQKEALVEAIT